MFAVCSHTVCWMFVEGGHRFRSPLPTAAHLLAIRQHWAAALDALAGDVVRAAAWPAGDAAAEGSAAAAGLQEALQARLKVCRCECRAGPMVALHCMCLREY